jgi:hypothetical protein
VFKIIGGDGREYGSADVEQVRRWMTEGRVNAQTLAQAVGTDEWKPLGSFAEFSQAAISGAPPPPLPSRPKTNGMAVAGFIFGLVGLFCCVPLFSIPGLVFSCVALSQIRRDPVRQLGSGLAVTGLTLSIFGLIVALIFGLMLREWRCWEGPPMHWRRQWRL